MEISVLQIVLICVYLAIWMMEQSGAQFLFLYSGEPIFNGLIVGAILGEPMAGLQIGASLQLMSLGVAAFGGSTIPDYPVGAVVGTMVAVMTKSNNLEYAVTFAVPVALMMTQLDILGKMVTAFFIQKSRTCASKLNMSMAYVWHILGIVPRILKPLIPVVLLYVVGADAINAIIEMMPDALLGSFKTVAGMLPALGLAILLKYMNTKKNLAFLILGFLLVAYLNIPILGVALFGVATSLIVYKNGQKGEVEVVGGEADEL